MVWCVINYHILNIVATNHTTNIWYGNDAALARVTYFILLLCINAWLKLYVKYIHNIMSAKYLLCGINVVNNVLCKFNAWIYNLISLLKSFNNIFIYNHSQLRFTHKFNKVNK